MTWNIKRLRGRSLLWTWNLRGSHKNNSSLLTLQLMKGVGKVIPSPNNQLQIKPATTAVYLQWGPSQLRSQTQKDHPCFVGSGNKNDAKIKVMDAWSVELVQHCSSHLCLQGQSPNEQTGWVLSWSYEDEASVAFSVPWQHEEEEEGRRIRKRTEKIFILSAGGKKDMMSVDRQR